MTNKTISIPPPKKYSMKYIYKFCVICYKGTDFILNSKKVIDIKYIKYFFNVDQKIKCQKYINDYQ